MIERLNSIVWGIPGLVLLLGSGLILTCRTRLVQFRLLGRSLRAFYQQLRSSDSGSFRPLCTALAATVGTGNIAGVAGAIAIGGPGAVFWMWISGFVGMATKYAEATLAVRYSQLGKGEERLGGPMYIIQKGLSRPWRPLAYIYSLFGIIASLGVGNATQINAVVSAIGSAGAHFGVTLGRAGLFILGGAMAALVWAMVTGGASKIGAAAELLVPFASVLYIAVCLVVIAMRFSYLDDALKLIISGAFSPKAVTGGAVGSCFLAVRYGVSRGVFSNEAGMGTAAMAHAGANVEHPAQQGMMGIVEVFLDTIVICTMTALVILVSGVELPYGRNVGSELTAEALANVLGPWVTLVLSLCLACFAFATILGWGLYAGRCIEFLLGKLNWSVFAICQAGAVFFGTVADTGIIWGFSELVNGLMAVPNLIALLLLSRQVREITLDYLK